MIRWNLQSNTCDVLGLGPRAAGRLASVGVRTVAELLAADPAVAADRQFDATTVAAWQREARLVLAVPELGPSARLLAALGIQSVEELQRTTPFELIARCERLWQGETLPAWLAREPRPSIGEICRWLDLVQSSVEPRAA